VKAAGFFRKTIAAVAITLTVAGAGLAAAPFAHGIIRQVSTAQAKTIWKKWKRSCAQRHPNAVARAPGEPALWLRVASCKISVLALQESDSDALHRFPAVRQLDGGGWVVLAHRDIHFRALSRIRIGDPIEMENADNSSETYTVRSIRILLPEQVPAILDDPETGEALHLLTCYPFRYVGAAPRRFLVTATRTREK
jgi:LPXTG-site transpeptidase (sortase) family protein